MESPVNLLESILSVDNVLLDVKATGRAEIFRAVAQLWHRNNGLDEAEVAAGLEMREELGSTGLGHGLAIPHARVKGLDKPLAAFVRLTTAIEFEAPDKEAVGDFFVLTVPAHATQIHLEILAEVAGKMSGTGFREELRAANTAADVVRLFSA
jgi:PTS system nitrogen regulatory IIA component